MSSFRILSLDAGGTKIQATLEVVCRLHRMGALAEVECLAGTSAGAVLACVLAAGIDPAKLQGIKPSKVLGSSPWWSLFSMGGLVAPVYDGSVLKGWLRSLFGHLTLAQLGKRVVIPTYSLCQLRTVLYHNLDPAGPMAREQVVEVLLRTCSVPALLPLHDHFMDGGLFAPNPVLQAALLCRRVLSVPLPALRLLSVGARTAPAGVPAGTGVGLWFLLLRPTLLVLHLYRALLHQTAWLLDELLEPEQHRRIEMYVRKTGTSLQGWEDGESVRRRLRTAGMEVPLPDRWLREQFMGART